ncbi:hypothetical protein EJ110_NYTH57598 [Nymphaea thermarum]|nr:hypothetical protein EJ110_NYTH57598 [Nymphaea thermarum]
MTLVDAIPESQESLSTVAVMTLVDAIPESQESLSTIAVFELREDGTPKMTVLGPDLEAGQHLQYTVPPNVWFGSFPTKDVLDYAPDGSSVDIGPSRDPDLHFSLVGCTCAPAFQFEDFELPKFSQLLAVAPNVEPFLRYLALPD